jgi:hypothetical protein
LVGTAVLGSAPSTSIAQDARIEAAMRALVQGQDFRLRVASALTLGKAKHPGVRGALEKALTDPHPAVRAAAGAALGAHGDAGAIGALRAASSKEGTASVKAQLETTIKRLASSASSAKPKFLVALGRLDTRTRDAGPSIVSTLKSATRARISQVPGVELLAEGTDGSAVGKSRGLPVLYVDGMITQLSKAQKANDVSYSARVEYMIRKIPEQSLKGTMTGRAEALADVRSVRGQTELSQLQVDAVAAAVDSAMKGASISFEAAATGK